MFNSRDVYFLHKKKLFPKDILEFTWQIDSLFCFNAQRISHNTQKICFFFLYIFSCRDDQTKNKFLQGTYWQLSRPSIKLLDRLPVYPFLVWEYFTVHSVGALFHIMLPRANTGCILYRQIHLIKRAVLKELISNKPILKIIYCTL